MHVKALTNVPFLRREILAGIVTFSTMMYIAIVNPSVLKDAGIPFDQAFTATIIATVVGTLLMGIYARFPIAIAPGMGLNAFFAYSVVMAHPGGKLPYTAALSAVFISAICFVILSLTPLRTKLIDAIPENLKYAITAGIGLFIAFIGLKNTGLVVGNPSTLVALGNFQDPKVLLAVIGLVVTLILMTLRIPGGLFIGMVVTGILAFFMGLLHFDGVISLPTLPLGLVAYNPVTAIGDIINYNLYAICFTFLIVTLFDTTGTVLGLSRQAGLMENGKLPRADRAFFSDSIATLVGSMFGTSPTSTFIESAAGISVGGKTGLTAIVVALLFLLTAFFSPVVSAISSVAAITGPALIIVGSLMMSHIGNIKWNEFDEAFPAFLTIIMMPLTYSIATGIAIGFVVYPILKLVRGQWRSIPVLTYVFALLFLLQFVLEQH